MTSAFELFSLIHDSPVVQRSLVFRFLASSWSPLCVRLALSSLLRPLDTSFSQPAPFSVIKKTVQKKENNKEKEKETMEEREDRREKKREEPKERKFLPRSVVEDFLLP